MIPVIVHTMIKADFPLDGAAMLVLHFLKKVRYGGCNGFIGENINQGAGGNSGRAA